MIKIGIAGLGKMGQNHLRELQKNPNFQVNALFDLHPKPELNEFGEIFHTDFDTFLEQNSDLIIIATPTNTHLEVAIKALRKCSALLIEKPLALNLSEIERLSGLSRGKKIAVGFCERFNPAVLALKKELENQKITSLSIQRFSPRPQRIKDVGILHDLAVHDLDLLGFLSKERIKKASVFSKFTQSQSIIACELENSTACLYESWDHPLKFRKIYLASEEHFFEADLLNFTLLKDGLRLELEPKLREKTPLFGEHEALLAWLDGGRHFLAGIEDAYRVQAVLEGRL